MIEKIKKLWLKYVVRYSNPQRYWDSRWKADLSAERATGQSALKKFGIIKSLMKKYSCKNILEIGCGKATLKNLPNYLGLDFSIKALELSGLDTFIFADITKRIPLANNSQDAVLSRFVLLHIPYSDIEKVVKEVSRVAKKLVILEEPWGDQYHVQPHCWRHNLPTLFKKHFQGHVEFLDGEKLHRT